MNDIEKLIMEKLETIDTNIQDLQELRESLQVEEPLPYINMEEYVSACEVEFQECGQLLTESTDESKLAKLGKRIKEILRKIKEFIIKIFRPLLRKLGLTDENESATVAQALVNVGIKLSAPTKGGVKTESAEEFSEATIYNPILFKRVKGKGHSVRNWASRAFVLYNLDTLDKELEDIIAKLKKGDIKASSSFFSAATIKDGTEIIIEEYVEQSYKILGKFDTVHDLALKLADNNAKRSLLDFILRMSNTVNVTMVNLHVMVHSFFEPIDRSVVSQFKNVEHIGRFVSDFMKLSNKNYLALRKALFKLLKLSKYKPANGASRIFIVDSQDDSHGYKIAYNTKGVIDNKREKYVWDKVKGKDLAKYFIPVENIISDGIIMKCRKAVDVGKLSKNEIRDMANKIGELQDKCNDSEVKDLNFKPDLIVSAGLFNAKTGCNFGNAARLNGNPVIIDFANITHGRAGEAFRI